MKTESELFKLVIKIHDNLNHADQNLIVKIIKIDYYDITRDEMIFLLKLYEMC